MLQCHVGQAWVSSRVAGGKARQDEDSVEVENSTYRYQPRFKATETVLLGPQASKGTFAGLWASKTGLGGQRQATPCAQQAGNSNERIQRTFVCERIKGCIHTNRQRQVKVRSAWAGVGMRNSRLRPLYANVLHQIYCFHRAYLPRQHSCSCSLRKCPVWEQLFCVFRATAAPLLCRKDS
jgi:hypothetical protein